MLDQDSALQECWGLFQSIPGKSGKYPRQSFYSKIQSWTFEIIVSMPKWQDYKKNSMKNLVFSVKLNQKLDGKCFNIDVNG